MAKSTNGNKPEAEAEQVLLTPQQAADYTGKKKKVIEKALTDPRYALIFAEAAVKRTSYPGYPDIVQIDRAALDAWLEALPPSHRAGEGTRAPRSDAGRRYVLRMLDENKEALIAALNSTGLPYVLESGYKSRSKKAKSNNAETSTPQFEHQIEETVSA